MEAKSRTPRGNLSTGNWHDRSQSVGFGGPVVRISPRSRWTDIRLPPGTLQRLRSLAQAVRRSSPFARRKVHGRAVLSLFAGGNGGIGVLAAEAVAHDLGLVLYHIDLAGVASKYIGETEKNLERAFDAAAASGGVLASGGRSRRRSGGVSRRWRVAGRARTRRIAGS
jgi:hypothetical protein